MKKISIIMPCYNDASTVLASIQSVEDQSCSNWELIVVNDGSTDESLSLIEAYLERSAFSGQIRVLSQENQDQLIAIRNGAQYVEGDYIYILHSDDFLYDEQSLERFLKTEAAHPGYDAYTGSRFEIDEEANPLREIKTRPILEAKHALKLTYLWLGRNIYMDVAFFERKAFEKHISHTYLNWNMPYWIVFDAAHIVQSLKLFNMDFPMLRYRIHEGNYLNSKLGAANVLSGELRCLLNLAAHFHIPAYRTQFSLYRLLNKIKPHCAYSPIAKEQRQKKLSGILNLVFEKAADAELARLPQFAAILRYFRQYDFGNAEISVDIPSLETGFFSPMGNQMRAYNRMMLGDEVPASQLRFLEQIAQGPSTINCRAKDFDLIERYLAYLGLKSFVNLVASD